MNKYLPIGSVVLLKNATKRLMIVSIGLQDLGSGVIYDYGAVLYPEGYVGPDAILMFNNSDVAKVYFPGYDDDERRQFLSQLPDFSREQAEQNSQAYYGQE